MDTAEAELLKDVWELSANYDISDWFPQDIAKWLKYQCTLLGVPDTFLSVPLIVSIAYLSQHATAEYKDIHSESLKSFMV